MEGVAPLVGIAAALCLWAATRAGFIGTALWFEASYTRAAQEMVKVYQSKGLRCFFVGIVNGLVGLFIAGLLMNMGPLALLGILLLLVLAAMVVIGYGLCYQDLGERLPLSGDGGARARKTLYGGIVAETAFLTPLIGQLLCIVILFRGLGAVSIGLLAMRKAATPETKSEAPAEQS